MNKFEHSEKEFLEVINRYRTEHDLETYQDVAGKCAELSELISAWLGLYAVDSEIDVSPSVQQLLAETRKMLNECKVNLTKCENMYIFGE